MAEMGSERDKTAESCQPRQGVENSHRPGLDLRVTTEVIVVREPYLMMDDEGNNIGEGKRL